ncbi:MAG: hypothetical protein SGILL_010594 [Bacillariaceae sp.]
MVTALVTSNNDELTPEYYKFIEDDEEYPNLTAGADFLKRGYGYYATLQTIRIDGERDGAVPALDEAVVIQTDKDVFITGMGLIEDADTVVIVGTLQGKSDNLFPTEREANDMDGFAVRKRLADPNLNNQPLRLNSVENKDDFVHNVCESPEGDSFFLVGSTMGTLANATMYGERESPDSLSAFVAKVEFSTMELVWATQFYPQQGASALQANSKAEAFGCHVVPHDSSTMYAGGVVFDGASFHSTKSRGSDDIFVAQMNTEDGSVTWVRQIGSSGKENMARNNGVFADMEGDCLLYGDTNGELYRSRHDKSETSDVFFVKLSQQDGAFSNTLEMNRKKHTGIGIAVFVFLALFAFSFYRFWGYYRTLKWKKAYKKDDDFVRGDSTFRDDPISMNGNHTNGAYGYSDEVEMPVGSYRDEAALRPGKSIV